MGISEKLDLRDSLPWYFAFIQNLRHYLVIGLFCCRLFQFHLSFLGSPLAECDAINLVVDSMMNWEKRARAQERKSEILYYFLLTYYCLSNMQF